MSGINFTFLIKQFQLRMECDLIEFDPYLDVLMIYKSSNTFWTPLVLWLCWSFFLYTEVVFKGMKQAFVCLEVDKYAVVQINYIFELKNP